MGKLYSIQYLRAVAALAVVAFHAGGLRYGETFGIGAAGVDIFFVISGFVMWSIGSADRQSAPEFLIRRLARVAPMYWLLTSLLIAGALLVPAAFPRMKLDIFHTIASLLFIPARSPIDSQFLWPVLVQGWTLNYEMFFYVIFALTLLLPKNARLTAMLALFPALALAGVFGGGTSPLFLVYTDQIMLEFVAGILLARLFELGYRGSRRAGYFLLGAGMIGYGLVAITDLAHPRLIVWGVPAFLVVAGLLAVELNGALIRSRVLTLAGDASYSIYLTHGITISLLGKFAGALPSPVLLALCLSMSTAVGIAVWWTVERPLTQTIQGMISRSKARFTIPGAVAEKAS
jgi:exopolysaccharide production protein ExoZ